MGDNIQKLRERLPYILLLLVAVLTVPAQLRFSWSTAQTLLRPDRQPQAPFHFGTETQVLESLRPEAEAAGLRKGDRLVAMNGAGVRGLTNYWTPIARSRPGDSLRVRVEREGRTVDAVVTVTAVEPLTSLTMFFPLVGEFLIPFFCIALGFGVALIRPKDPLAWLLLGMMLCFSCMMEAPLMLRAASWEPVLRDIVVFVRFPLSLLWGPAMLLFGIYFPERLALDRRRPWLKWLILAPALLYALAAGVYYVELMEDFRTAAQLDVLLNRLGSLPVVLMFGSTSVFFWTQWHKLFQATGDARRRLGLLVAGTTAAMTPLLPLGIASQVTGRPIQEVFPLWLVAFAVAMLLLFPLTMAYVIVVQRALDLRVVLRQGVRYALATRGVRLLQVLIAAATILYVADVAQSGRMSRPQTITSIALAVLVVTGARSGGERLSKWLDRKFFREAFSAEQVLSELSEKVRTIVETSKLVETIAEHVAQSLHIDSVAVLLEEGGRYRLSHATGLPEKQDIGFAKAGGVAAHLRASMRPALVYLDDEKSWLRRSGIGADERAALQSLEAQVLVPLASGDKLPGFLALGPKRSDQPYSNSDLSLLRSVAGQVGLALENSRLTAEMAGEVARREMLRREVAIAREVQQRLFPQRLPVVQGISYAGTCRPASEVGGDYYDFLDLPDGRFGIAIGDVSGKGIPAALLMASMQASLRGQAMSMGKDLAELMGNVNRLLYDASPRSHFATLFFGCYDPATRCLAYVNAGHNAPMLARQNGSGPEVIRLAGHGVGAGLTRAARYTEARMQLHPGDLLVGFTDGIAEAMNSRSEEWGEEGLAQALPLLAARPVPEVMEGVLAAAESHAAGAPQHDDMTIVVLRVEH